MTTEPPRRKGPKTLPKLPLSAFSPPNSGVSENFPLPPSPSTVHPERVIDAAVGGPLAEWKAQATGAIEGRASAVVVLAPEGHLDGLEDQATAVGVEILAAQIPFRLEDGPPPLPESALSLALSTSFPGASDVAADGLSRALADGHVVDLAVGELATWDALEELLAKAATTPPSPGAAIVLGGLLPPPHDLALPIVKLLTHPSYVAYQAHIAALSLVPAAHAKFLPPVWGSHAPADEAERKEWKRRIKMYLGPAVEAFGFERILFGSAAPAQAQSQQSVGDWYELARESFAELGVDQDAVDAIFGGNARRVYGKRT
ncbi:hypothetical protein K488DRAFT_57181 [Vararia minispora EC-137]|uniref:Uncharacterized protein n=1 Tax=Vararia minispora EC-137 TaxID=1314806 RepID=A0ACB8QCT6_9AGAM|nr:hypothetical protein K488DRAFT_57181 [Vararia minispora EC-137]